VELRQTDSTAIKEGRQKIALNCAAITEDSTASTRMHIQVALLHYIVKRAAKTQR
jgi:hypothetical protein